MRIKQFYCGLPFFREGMKQKFSFDDYTDRTQPLFVHGCYGWKAWSNILLKHESLVVFAPAGDDAHKLADPINAFWVEEFKKRPNIKYLANDTWIKEALASVGLYAERVPFTPFTGDDIKPCPLGDSIYVYKPNVETYGSELYRKVKERLTYKFIESEGFTRTREEVLQCYRDSFMGLRLMETGGLAVTVIELGLMGRMCIHNGDHPNCVHYDKNDIDGIVEAIDHEYWHARNPLDNNAEAEETANNMRNFLNIGEDFLETSFYASH